MIVRAQAPLTVPVSGSGEHTILPTISAPGTTYRLHRIQFMNKGKAVEVEIKEGVYPRWKGQIPRDAQITVDYGVPGWSFQNNTPMIVNALGNANMDVNMLSFSTVQIIL